MDSKWIYKHLTAHYINLEWAEILARVIIIGLIIGIVFIDACKIITYLPGIIFIIS